MYADFIKLTLCNQADNSKNRNIDFQMYNMHKHDKGGKIIRVRFGNGSFLTIGNRQNLHNITDYDE